ncbi:MAG: adenylate kinase family protein [Archaeoglobaceae archaeon]|nr:adenylate kinase family protein [Archaeoglobaceae archaeon]
MKIALTGTPGCGKSTVARELKKIGYKVVKVEELAKKFDCILSKNDEIVVDVDKLAREFSKVNFDGIIEGHLSHLLNPDIAIVLRCNPIILKKRLEKRGWSKSKVLENVEAELIDVILVEALECKKIYEIDTTNRDAKEVAKIIDELIKGEDIDKFKPGKIDWIKEIGDDIDLFLRKNNI